MDVMTEKQIVDKIYIVRGIKVMFDNDLAMLYGVETKQLKRQVGRNIDRFPDDFMFKLNYEEYREFIRCQFGSLKQGKHSKYQPMVFTELGVAMLSSVLQSQRAVHVNIQIKRIFANLRRIISSNETLMKRIDEMERKYDGQFRIVFVAIRQLLKEEETEDRKIGFTF
ncbi:MAG: ORF6N domain-containing protein [Spirochaetes bacterium]|nr:ORF6N domain-containing protein [Spirochaetota bacterium]